MTESEAKQILKQLEEYQKEVTSSPEKAREALIRAGIITEYGEIVPAYKNTRLWE